MISEEDLTDSAKGNTSPKKFAVNLLSAIFFAHILFREAAD